MTAIGKRWLELTRPTHRVAIHRALNRSGSPATPAQAIFKTKDQPSAAFLMADPPLAQSSAMSVSLVVTERTTSPTIHLLKIQSRTRPRQPGQLRIVNSP